MKNVLAQTQIKTTGDDNVFSVLINIPVSEEKKWSFGNYYLLVQLLLQVTQHFVPLK